MVFDQEDYLARTQLFTDEVLALQAKYGLMFMVAKDRSIVLVDTAEYRKDQKFKKETRFVVDNLHSLLGLSANC
jgi:hypothetical protein